MKKSHLSKSKPSLLTRYIIQGLQEKKGHDIVSLDLRKNKNPIADYFIICTGDSDRHVHALAESVEETVFKKSGFHASRREGLTVSEWVILDYFDVIVHIFLRSKREFYGLEELWGDAEVEKVDKVKG